MNQVSKTQTFSQSAESAFDDAKKALEMLGKIKSVDVGGMTIKGTVNYGFQNLAVQVNVSPQGESSTVTVTSLEVKLTLEDAAQNCFERFFETFSNVHNPDFKPNRRGLSPMRMGVMVILLAAGIFVFLMINDNTNLKSSNLGFILVPAISVVSLIIFLVKRKK